MFRITALTVAQPTPIPNRVAPMRRFIAIAALTLGLVSAAPAARADIITQDLAGTGNSGPELFFIGQSLVTPAGGPWHDLTFNFFSNVPATTPTAVGTAFLLSQEYLGTPANLSSSTPGYLASSTGIVAGRYVFAPGVTVQPNTTYWVYENAEISSISGNNTVSAFHDYFSGSATSNFAGFSPSENFRLSGDVVTSAVPAPPAVVLVGLGAGCVVLKRYVHRRATA
jgi:hypothetical protein